MIDIVEILIHWYWGPLAARAGRELGSGTQDAVQVPGPGAGGGDGTGWPPDERGGLGGPGIGTRTARRAQVTVLTALRRVGGAGIPGRPDRGSLKALVWRGVGGGAGSSWLCGCGRCQLVRFGPPRDGKEGQKVAGGTAVSDGLLRSQSAVRGRLAPIMITPTACRGAPLSPSLQHGTGA